MKPKSYKIIFLLISISSLGVIGMQLSWLYKQYQSSKNQFHIGINQALKDVNKQVSQIYSTTAELDEDHIDEMDYYFRNRDSTLTFIFESLDRKKNWDGSRYNLNEALRKKRINEFKKFVSKINIEDQFSESFIVLYGNMDTLIDQSKNWKMLVKDQGVKSLIQQKLKENKIDVFFNFGILNTDKNTWDYISDSSIISSLEKTPYSNRFVTDETKIYLLVEEKPFSDLKNMLPYVLLSLLLLSIIIGSFYFLLRIIWNQKKVSEIKSDFINNMTHEFKTPIATIDFAVANIRNPMFINDEKLIYQFTEIIKKENARMNEQVEKVLQAAVNDKKENKMEFRRLDFHKIIEEQAESVKLRLQSDNQLIQQLNAINTSILGDKSHLRNVLSTILDNAIKYSIDPVKIELITRNDKGKFVLEIKDNGIGINSEDQQLIFDKFFRVSTGNIHNVKGFGLGLNYAKFIIEQHGGSISVKSKPDEGSTFILELPFINNYD